MEKKTTEIKEKKAKEAKPTVIKEVVKKKTAFTAPVFDISGKSVEQIELSQEVFGVKPNKDLIAQAVRVFLANQREGNADTKVRGEVRGGGRKPWKQKGTGRARIGSTRAPHWRGGGVTFGPTPRDFSLNFPKKMKKAALISALSAKFIDKGIVVLKDLNFKEAKTKEAAKMLKSLNIEGKNMIVAANFENNEKRALGNLAKTKIQKASNLNVYEVLNNKKMLVTKEAIKTLEENLKGKE